MTIQHKDITDVNLHEPKGAVSAGVNTAYFSNGAGSGTWKKTDTTTLKGLTTDGGSTNSKLVTDGSQGFVLRLDKAYANMAITNNTNAFSVTAAADATLNTNSDYVLLTGTGAPWGSESSFGGVVFDGTNRITVPVTGVYRIDLWATVNGWPNIAAKVSVKYRINGTTFSTRHPVARSPGSTTDPSSLAGFGLISLTANDYLQIYIACTHTGSVIFSDLNTLISLERQTA